MSDFAAARRPQSAFQERQKLTAIASGKGGVGKTWLAVTLSHAMARAGERALLFDGDLGLANVDIQLGLTPKLDLGQMVTGELSLEACATAYATGGFDVIAGRSGSAGLTSLNDVQLSGLSQGLVAMAPNYDQILLDLGAGVDRTVLNLAGDAGRILVVTTEEPTALTDAYAFVKLCLRRDRSMDLRLVVNMAESVTEGQRIHTTLLKACRHFLSYDIPLAGIIRRDKKVQQSIRQQQPTLTCFPNSPAAEDVEALAGDLRAG